MDKIICQICQESFEQDLVFHKHLRKHKLIQSEYYQKFYSRFDRFDHGIIKYKNKEYYFTTEFNSRGNLKKWLNSVTSEKAKEYIISFLKNRKDNKGMTYAPTQVELRTLALPGRIYIEEKFGNYNDFCAQIGLLPRFSNEKLDESLFKDISKKVIFADKREQTPLTFNNQTRSKSMSFGDYRQANSDVYIERKSLADCWSTLSTGFNRFEKEIIRANEANSYLVILVENGLEELSKFPFQYQVRGKIKLPVQFIEHNIRILLQKYQHIQFLFCKGRDESSRLVEKIFSAGEQVKNVDLQYLLDGGKL